ncbi:1,4-alpha-glucan branching protein domain-containing protein [candidate division KSB1 bacterium]
MDKSYGKFNLVLHGHIPYVVSHGRWPHGTDWLSEAVAECYLPILRVLRELEEENVYTRITMGITPILAEQLSDPVFHEEVSQYLKIKIDAANEDRDFFIKAGEQHMAHLAEKWIEFYNEAKNDFEVLYDRNILKGFNYFLDKGVLDIITCGATHGYFPLLGEDASINLQVRTAVETHKKHFGKAPTGIWMPECAYRPGYSWKRPVEKYAELDPVDRYGIEEFLIENGIKYTFIDSHMLKGGRAIGAYADRFEGLKLLIERSLKAQKEKEIIEDLSPYKLYKLQSSRNQETITLFTRDPKTGLQVWSGEHGYPGDGYYMDFHKKRFPGGLRYWRVTSAKCGLGEKEVYSHEEVEKRLEENASHFVDVIYKQLEENYNTTGEEGVLTAPYDAELFGHWWFEGVSFIKKLFQKLAQTDHVKPATAAEVNGLDTFESIITIPEGSWGEDGHHFIWLNEQTAWTWEEIYEDELNIMKFVKKAQDNGSPEFRDVVTQLVRELLLEQASDWQFLISTFSARDYAEMRLVYHHNAIKRLTGVANRFLDNGILSDEDKFILRELKEQDHAFQNLNIDWYKNI